MNQELPAKVTFNPAALAQSQKRADTELAEIEGATIDDDDDARAANSELRDRVTELAAVEAMRAETLAPLRELEKKINALFAPTITKYKALTLALRGLLEGYELEKRAASRLALAAAAQAATLPTADALHTALAAAQDAAPTHLEGTAFVRTWSVARIAEGLLPDEWWVPDLKKIAAVGKAHKGDDPPIIPGVIWQEELSSRVRKNT